MTVSANYKPIAYVGNGVVTNFVITWKFFDNEVVVTDEYGRALSGYEVINSGNGGTVIFNEAPVGKIFISRKVKYNQDVEFNEGENFPAEDYEYSLDRIYMALQELGYKVGRGVQLPEGAETLEDVIKNFVSADASNRAVYDNGVTYKKGDICFDDTNYTLYYRYGNSVTGQRPSINVAGWQILGNYIPESFIDGKLRNFYTKEEVDNKIGDIDSVLDTLNGEVI